jgi:NADH:ubiquinone oxidoreductase subunit 6 (subunit J)
LPDPPQQPPPEPPPPETQTPEAPAPQPPLPQEQPDQAFPDLEEIDIFEQEIPHAPIEIEDPESPRAYIYGIPLLLFAPPGISSWALLNLMMSIAGVILVVITIIRLLTYKRKEDKKVHDRINNSFNEEFENPESNDPSKKFKLTWFTVGAVAALMAVIVFILTQDITATIALADWWTIVHIVVLTVVAASCVIVLRGQKSTKENGSDKNNNAHNQV